MHIERYENLQYYESTGFVFLELHATRCAAVGNTVTCSQKKCSFAFTVFKRNFDFEWLFKIILSSLMLVVHFSWLTCFLVRCWAVHLITFSYSAPPLNSLRSPTFSLQCSTNKTWSGWWWYLPWFGDWPELYNFPCAWGLVGRNGRYAEMKENIQLRKRFSLSSILEIYILLGHLWCV